METHVIGLYGPTLDAGQGRKRWERWRPTVSLLQQPDLQVTRLDLLVTSAYTSHAQRLTEDMQQVSPGTAIHVHELEMEDPWDFEGVFAALHSFATDYDYRDEIHYLVHITTGTHVAQICLFLLTEARYFPAQLIQTSPTRNGRRDPCGSYQIIDLDLSRYDAIATRFGKETEAHRSHLKSGIATRNAHFNHMIDEIELVAMRSQAPILLMGPTGAGKSQLAKRLYELKRSKHQLKGEFVEVNCSTLRGEGAMSALFGHTRGAFTGALSDRPGLLRLADRGLLFLDEIGELGLDEQAMLLRALEDGRFLPLGSDRETESRFQLIAGTNRDLWHCVAQGAFREDLLARINTWSFELPALRDRLEDLEPNLQYELAKHAQSHGVNVRFNSEAYRDFLKFALSAEASWTGNFRDLNAAVQRMATLAPSGRITQDVVAGEILRLKRNWRAPEPDPPLLLNYLSEEEIEAIDRFDRIQLTEVIQVCQKSRTLSEAGRHLFQASRLKKKNPNDADRLRKYLQRFGLSPSQFDLGHAVNDL
ncbi:MAG: RNA repair transcriptional activator RtcR [Acidobacteria bacterium]|nr:RNA repair transcriptional activator RtcR [Acidobacteriota bacterium]